MLNVHAHTQVLDGGYVWSDGKLTFHELYDVKQEDVQWVAERAHKRIEAVLVEHGRSLQGAADIDPVSEKDPFLAHCYAGAIAGKGTLRLIDNDEHSSGSGASKTLLAQIGVVNVHAERVVDGRDRAQLERMCRYMLRPAFAQDRIRILSDGRVHYQMKNKWRDGTSSLVFEPMEFIRRLCSFVPAPTFHMIRYYGVLAPNSCVRNLVVPRHKSHQEEQLSLFEPRDVPLITPAGSIESSPSRIAWAQLLKRVFKFDVTVCHKCQGRVRITKAVTKKDDIRRILLETGLPVDAPEPHPARPPPQTHFDDLHDAY